MGSLFEELDVREAAARARIGELRQQIAELTESLDREESMLSRLEITRETVTEILGEAGTQELVQSTEPPAGTSQSGEGSPIGVLTVPPWRPGMSVSVLPRSYQDLVEALADTGHAMRAGQVAAAAGLSTDKSKIEGLRSKLNRLAERGWLALEGLGLFIVAHPDAEGASSAVGRASATRSRGYAPNSRRVRGEYAPVTWTTVERWDRPPRLWGEQLAQAGVNGQSGQTPPCMGRT
ncbi:hypothetical protein [Streptomyces sp. SA15]|uniref:hypothetical protein n=1 Tax=Streptomyces sp. SA15 TaxID=934019 RepID=UPI0011800792|nr:hypothetical protein [Streptomyces sp. SA15]